MTAPRRPSASPVSPSPARARGKLRFPNRFYSVEKFCRRLARHRGSDARHRTDATHEASYSP